MGNYKLRLSDMIPNAWFYKLRDMKKTHNKKLSSSTPHQKPTSSIYYTDSVFNSPRNSKYSDPPRNSSNRKTIYYKPSQRQVNSPNSAFSKPESTQFQVFTSPEPDLADSLTWSSSYTCRVSSSATDIIIDINEKSYAKKTPNSYGFDPISETELLTKPINEINNSEETAVSRKSLSRYSGVKIKKIQRKGISNTRSRPNKGRVCESFAMVKSSFDPQKDFRESMMEMIVENNIRAAKDLEDLLACYLSLNSDEFHHLIVKAFQQIWFKIPHINVCVN